MPTNRRDFLRTVGAAGVALGAGPLIRAQGKHTYRTALVGTGWWGMNLLREALGAGQAKVAGLCDVDPKALEVSADEVKDMTGDEPKKYRDFRDLLDKEKPEIVIIATPDHWHALQSIAALRAGAHVFVEKPT